MPSLTDSVVLAQFQEMLANWNFTGYVTAKDVVLDWIAKNLHGQTLKDVARAMDAHLKQGGTIDQVPETRPEWSQWPFHYDFRLRLGNLHLYIETILNDNDPKDPTIHIVSIHNA